MCLSPPWSAGVPRLCLSLVAASAHRRFLALLGMANLERRLEAEILRDRENGRAGEAPALRYANVASRVQGAQARDACAARELSSVSLQDHLRLDQDRTAFLAQHVSRFGDRDQF